jgi:catechol 2,3-dioxygenase-like lactoylglutathione lyase family enzyme
MIGYAMLGTNDMPRALGFYDDVLSPLGAKRMMGGEKFQTYGVQFPSLGICHPYDGNAATVGNGTMIALSADNRDQVGSVHAKALAAGGKDEGAPGIRGGDDSDFYAAYFRDLDGNKLCVFKVG